MLTLIIIKEIALILMALALPIFLFYSMYRDNRSRKEHSRKMDTIASKLLEKADDEKPIMLNVDQEKLIDKTIDEIERREARRVRRIG